MKHLSKAFADSFRPILTVYVLWVVVQYGALHIHLEMAPDGLAANLFFFGVSVLFALFGLLLTAAVLVYGGEPFCRHPSTRKIYLIGTLVVGAVLAVLIRAGGQKAPIVFILNSANLLVFAVLLGSWLATAVKRPAEIILLCVLLLWIDCISVLIGPTRWIAERIADYYRGGMQGAVPFGDLLLVKTVVPGWEHPYPIFGVSDWIILVFLSASAAKFHINDNLAGKSLEAMISEKRMSVYISIPLLGLLISLLAAQLSGFFVPALSVISVLFGFHVYTFYRPLIRMEKNDWVIVVVFTVVAVFLLVLKTTAS